MNVFEDGTVLQNQGLKKVSLSEAEDYYSEDFLKKYKISGNDEMCIPLSWMANRGSRNNVFQGSPTAFAEAASRAEKIIRHIDEKMVSSQYNCKPAASAIRAGQHVFKWGTGRHGEPFPLMSWARAFAEFYRMDYVALCVIRHNPSRDMYSAMVFFRDGAVI